MLVTPSPLLHSQPKSTVGTPAYIAPGVLARKEYDGKDMLFAGSDTSSTTVEWAMASLLENPEVMEKVKRELTRVVGTRAQVQESDIAQLPYLQAVVKEVLRLYPVVAMTYYRAEATAGVQGYTIPQGATIILNIWAVHRNADVWPDPHKFVPERFMGDDGNNITVDFSGKDCNLIPFSV